MNEIIFFSAYIVWLFLMYTKIKYLIHMLQLEGYSNKKFTNWIKNNDEKVFTKKDNISCTVLILLLALFLFLLENRYASIYIGISMIVVDIILLIITYMDNTTPKKPLVYTKRAQRLSLLIVSLVMLAFFIVSFVIFFVTNSIAKYLPFYAFTINLIYFCSVYFVVIGNQISVPLENKINMRYYKMACNKIKGMKDLKVVGITGSYGKTSTKYITATILATKYKVLKTPESYNTPMGISKVINNDLNSLYNVFIAELGATKKDDISEVAELTSPHIGVITSIGPCHLQSFGSIENIINTKYELIEKLPKDGIAIFNYGNEYVRRLADKTQKEKLLYAVEKIKNVDIYAENITVDENGSSFDLNIKDIGSIKCKTALLGKHNIENILAGACIGYVLGLSLDEIQSGIQNIMPVKHRLQLIDPKSGILVIDDAFNSNPTGANAALDVLNEFIDRRKIIVTPGMIELGSIEKTENRKLGEKISKICDIVILVGSKRTEPIQLGLRESNFDMSNTIIVNSTNAAAKILKSITKHGDVVLFENDLPDTYDEI